MKRIPLPETLDRHRLAALVAQISGATEPLLFVGACAGADLGGDLEADEGWNLLRSLFVALHTGPPTAVLVTGPVLGGGLGLVAACDRVVATPTATFALPELIFGLVPGAIAPALCARIGAGGVRRLALGPDPLDARQALALGLVDRIAPDARQAVRHLLRLDGEAVRGLRALLQPDYLDALDAGIAASRRRVPQARTRLDRWSRGEVPWSM